MISEDEAIAAVAEKYGLDAEDVPDVSDPEVSRTLDEEIARECRPEIEKWDRYEAWSMAHAYEVWTW